MSYTYFDPDDFEREYRAMDAEMLTKLMAAARTDLERTGYELQHRMLEPEILAHREVIKMFNESRDGVVICRTVGSSVGRLIANCVAFFDKPEDAIPVILNSITAALTVLTDAPADNIHKNQFTITGQSGGRA